MNILLISSAVALAMTSPQLAAGAVNTPGDLAQFEMLHGEQLWLAKGGNGHGNDKALEKGNRSAGNGKPGKGKVHAGSGDAKPGNGNGGAAKANGKPEHAGGPKPRTNGKGLDQGAGEKGKNGKDRRPFTTAERGEAYNRLVSTPAPPARDMKRVLSAATALALVTPQLRAAEIDDDELVTYRNCPPGLAKKDPPCVPPGLVGQGITYDEWVAYDQEEYGTLWVDRRDKWINSGIDAEPNPDLLLLQSDQIAELFDLDPAPDGQRYGLIDGLPVLLDHQDYNALLLVNQKAQVPDVGAGTSIAPTAALTQDELIDLYRLPQLGDNENYAVVNGQVVRLNDSNYDLLQMLRIARAVM